MLSFSFNCFDTNAKQNDTMFVHINDFPQYQHNTFRIEKLQTCSFSIYSLSKSLEIAKKHSPTYVKTETILFDKV